MQEDGVKVTRYCAGRRSLRRLGSNERPLRDRRLVRKSALLVGPGQAHGSLAHDGRLLEDTELGLRELPRDRRSGAPQPSRSYHGLTRRLRRSSRGLASSWIAPVTADVTCKEAERANCGHDGGYAETKFPRLRQSEPAADRITAR